MRTLDAIARIHKKECIERLSAFTATALIKSAMVEADLSKTEIRISGAISCLARIRPPFDT